MPRRMIPEADSLWITLTALPLGLVPFERKNEGGTKEKEKQQETTFARDSSCNARCFTCLPACCLLRCVLEKAADLRVVSAVCCSLQREHTTLNFSLSLAKCKPSKKMQRHGNVFPGQNN